MLPTHDVFCFHHQAPSVARVMFRSRGLTRQNLPEIATPHRLRLQAAESFVVETVPEALPSGLAGARRVACEGAWELGREPGQGTEDGKSMSMTS